MKFVLSYLFSFKFESSLRHLTAPPPHLGNKYELSLNAFNDAGV